MKEIALDVQGMSCGHCVHAVQQALTELAGVEVRHVAIGSATIAIDPGRTTIGAVIDAVGDAGYEAQERA